MNSFIIPSTLLLTLLMLVGLFFFIRASVKDRTQEVKLTSEQPEASLVVQLQQYLQERSYKVTKVDAEHNLVTFEGIVQPSVFLAIFLTLLAAIGTLCLALVLSFLFPSLSKIFLLLVLLSPAAGVFYWKKAGRKEQVSLKMEATKSESQSHSKITVIAHRDELAELQRALQLKPCE
ncbi:MAG: cofactor assembly of complex C subunit B [Gloeocapsa sp. UFS-A4-WI-NPMV-4B04]|jgi:Flp pilus assembly protein TadB|nr:cofactor assembly of complex C subunit B [Gloeocapsa sp. UFS-A4-WI-NPMV-4B04]